MGSQLPAFCLWNCFTDKTAKQNLLHHIAMHIRQPEVAALEAVGQPGVLQAEQVQDGRLQVVDVDRILADVEAKLVGSAVGEARLRCRRRPGRG